jgi:hypothetical protein
VRTGSCTWRSVPGAQACCTSVLRLLPLIQHMLGPTPHNHINMTQCALHVLQLIRCCATPCLCDCLRVGCAQVFHMERSSNSLLNLQNTLPLFRWGRGGRCQTRNRCYPGLQATVQFGREPSMPGMGTIQQPVLTKHLCMVCVSPSLLPIAVLQ